MKWQPRPATVSGQAFWDLFDNTIPYIQIDDFLTPAESAKLCEVIASKGLGQYQYNFDLSDAPVAHHLFETHYLYENKTPEEYFPVAEKSIQEYAAFCQQAGFDPVKKMMAFFENQIQKPVHIATQMEKQYTYVMIRELKNSALLHADFAQFVPSYWSISNMIAQYAWNIYLTDPGEGGECIVYNKPWEKEDDQYLIKDTYGYDPIIVKDKEFAEISIKANSLVFFNSRNFHKVNSSKNTRLSVGGHVGLTNKGEVLVWV